MLLVTMLSYSQTVSRQVIGAAGTTQTNSNLKVSWTAGEPVIGLMTSGGNQLGNGYYPAMDLQALELEDSTLDVKIKVFPNPTSELLYVSHPEMDSFTVEIADVNGKQLFTGTVTKDMPLNLSSYLQGMYLITVINKVTHKKNTYKIIKE